MQKLYCAFLVWLLTWVFTTQVQAQCSSYAGTQIAVVVPATRTASTAVTVTTKNYLRVAVVKGIQYTMSSSAAAYLAVTDSTGSSTGAQASSAAVSSITYAATYSGYVRFYNCNSGSVNLSVAIGTATTQNTNTQDNSTLAGTNVWREHMYQRLDNTAGAPTDANAFSRYLGYRDTFTTETFNNTFGSDGGTYALKSGGRYLILNTNEFFAVQYYMLSTKAAGAYIADMNGDDGIRLKVDGTLYFNKWVEQGNTTYTKELFPLNGNSTMLFEYYESGGGNVAGFNNFLRVANTITIPAAKADTTVCNNTSIAFGGNNTFTDAPLSSTASFTVAYQWARSTDGTNYTNVSGATSQTYTTPALTAGTYFYRRTATVARTNDGMSTATSVPDQSNIIKVVVRSTPTVTLSGGGNVCQNSSASIIATNPQSEQITIGYSTSGAIGSSSGAAPVNANSSAAFPFPTGSPGSSTITVTSIYYSTAPACMVSNPGISATVNVQPSPSGTIVTNTPICLGTTGKITFSASAGTGPYSLVINSNTYSGIASGAAFNVNPNPTTTTTYDLTRITDANGCASQ